jgi:hypothetical protein
MSTRTRLLLHALAGLLLTGLACARWWGMGPLGEDLLLAHDHESALAPLSSLGRASLELSSSIFGPFTLERSPVWDLLRLENLLLLLGSGWLCALLLARSVEPWLGAEAARAVLRTGVLVLPASSFMLLHGAHALARGECLALFYTMACALFYLRSRQRSGKAGLFVAALLALGAGASGHASFGLPVLIGALEWLSARRHRKLFAQWRSSLTALLAFGALRMGAAHWAGEQWAAQESGAQALALCLAALGRSLAPLDSGTDLLRTLAAGVLVLAALQPMLLSARTAPRTWGRFALAWLAITTTVLAGSLCIPVEQRLQPWYLELLAPSILFTSGLCVAISARGGWRRAVLPWLLALGGLWIGQPLLDVPKRDRAALEELRARVQLQLPRAAEAEWALTGLESQRWALGSIPRRQREAVLAAWLGVATRVHCLSETELLRWADMEAFPERVLVLDTIGSPRLLVRSPSSERLFWRESSRSPQVLDLDPRLHRAVRLVARTGTPTERAPQLFFRAEGADQPVSCTGIWLAGEEPPVAWFELSREPRWMLAERIRRIWAEGDLTQVTSAEVLRQWLEPKRPWTELKDGGVAWFWVAWDPATRRVLERELAGPQAPCPPTPPGGEAWRECRLEGLRIAREKL